MIHIAGYAAINPLVPTWGGIFGSLMVLGLIVVAVIAVLRSEHSVAAKAGMLLLCFLVPVIGAIASLVLARQEPDRIRRAEAHDW